jgi:hypothetical protein
MNRGLPNRPPERARKYFKTKFSLGTQSNSILFIAFNIQKMSHKLVSFAVTFGLYFAGIKMIGATTNFNSNWA